VKKQFKRFAPALIIINLLLVLSGCTDKSGQSSSTTAKGNRVSLQASPSTVKVGGSSAIYLEVNDSSGSLASSSPTVVFSTSQGTLLDPDVPADEDTVLSGIISKTASGGKATVLLTSDTIGIATVTATVAGELISVQVTFVE